MKGNIIRKIYISPSSEVFMNVIMIFPDISSEKAISNYSLHLIDNINKQGIKVDKLTYIAGKPLSFFRILKFIKNHDIIHLQHEYNLLGNYGLPFFFFLPLIKMFNRNKLIITMHTIFSQKEKFKESILKTFFRKLLYRLQNRIIRKFSDKVIVHSDFFKNILIKEYYFEKEKIEVIPHGIIENVKKINKQIARKELNLSGKIYLMIGNLIYDNGTDIILRQANKIGKTILVATNPQPVNVRGNKARNYLKSLKEIVSQNNFENFVRFDLKDIPYSLWWKYFFASDLVLLPYRGGVGSGIFSDAMAVGKPVIASNIPYFKRIEEQYKSLKIAQNDFDFSRTIKEALIPKNYKKMESECKRYLKENGLTPVSKKYKELYLSLLE